MVEEIRSSGSVDKGYTAIIKALREHRLKGEILSISENPCREYMSIWDRLGVLDDRDASLILEVRRLVVPMSQHQNILKILHLSHQGMNKTYAAARSRYYWPSLKEDYHNKCETCGICREFKQRLFRREQKDH